jgi:hypothetical protein
MKETFITSDRQNSCSSMIQDKLVRCSWTRTGLRKRVTMSSNCVHWTKSPGTRPGLVHSGFSSVNTVTVETHLNYGGCEFPFNQQYKTSRKEGTGVQLNLPTALVKWIQPRLYKDIMINRQMSLFAVRRDSASPTVRRNTLYGIKLHKPFSAEHACIL